MGIKLSAPASENKVQLWWSEFYKTSNELRESESFRNKIKGIKEKKLDKDMIKKQIDLFYEEMPENYLTQKINNIIKSNNLPINYSDSIRRHILFGDITAPISSFNIISLAKDPTVRLRESVIVEFKAKLTDDDLKLVKALVNKSFLGEELPESPEPIKDIDAKIKIEEKKKEDEEGMSDDSESM